MPPFRVRADRPTSPGRNGAHVTWTSAVLTRTRVRAVDFGHRSGTGRGTFDHDERTVTPATPWSRGLTYVTDAGIMLLIVFMVPVVMIAIGAPIALLVRLGLLLTGQ